MKKYKVTVDGQSFTVLVEELPPHENSPTETRVTRTGLTAPAKADPEPPPSKKAPKPQNRPQKNTAAVNVESPMPGSIVDISVKQGDLIKEGDVLLVLEAMKMENEITAPRSGTVRAVHVKVGDNVDSGDLLVEIS